MASPHTGSNGLVFIHTDKISVTIKDVSDRPCQLGAGHTQESSVFKAYCREAYQLSLKGGEEAEPLIQNANDIYMSEYVVSPLFFEQQRYQISVEVHGDYDVVFWHENIHIRSKVTPLNPKSRSLAGVVSFGSDIGSSDLVVKIDGQNYLRIVIEVFPSKIGYKDDYQDLMADVTSEIYGLAFDFLKKTYQGYWQGESLDSSPVEFFAVIQSIYSDFLKAADRVSRQPHHTLESHRMVLPDHKIKRTDNRTLKWLRSHPDQVVERDGWLNALKAPTGVKKVTYDTLENRLAKHILNTTVQKLASFQAGYAVMKRTTDTYVIDTLNQMIDGVKRRADAPVFASVGPYEATASMSLVFSMAPGYRELYKYYLMLQRGLSITGEVFNISVKDLAVLYEYWCFIKLNRLMRDRYVLLSQDIIKTQGNGLFVSLVKGSGSKVKYWNPGNNEIITLSYNPKATRVPTVAQRPDNVLTLSKNGAKTKYEYVFDAKYRMNPALPGTEYAQYISSIPGPEVDDINTMHQYRDAIMHQNGSNTSYERTMFGAYVLFPLQDEEQYKRHRFYESIDKVNVGGLPFLPSATKLTSNLLDELISDSPDSAFERTTLPIGIEEKLAKVNWTARDVLVGALHSREQLDIALEHKVYHIPASKVSKERLPIRYIAIYQSKVLFGDKLSGVRYFGEVFNYQLVKRSNIPELPKNSEKLYYRFEIKEWRELERPLKAVGIGARSSLYTNLFLLQNVEETPDLLLRSEAEYRLYTELKRAVKAITVEDKGKDRLGIQLGDQKSIVLEEDDFLIVCDNSIKDKIPVAEFARAPRKYFQRIQSVLVSH